MQYRWDIDTGMEGRLLVLHEVPTEPIKTMHGSVLPPYVLTAWDDASLAAVGIKRIEVAKAKLRTRAKCENEVQE